MQPAVQGRTLFMDAVLYRLLSQKITGLPAPNVAFVDARGKITGTWFDVLTKASIANLPSEQSRVVNTVTGRLEPDWFRALNTYLES